MSFANSPIYKNSDFFSIFTFLIIKNMSTLIHSSSSRILVSDTESTRIRNSDTESTRIQNDDAASTRVQHNDTASTRIQHNDTASTRIQHNDAESTRVHRVELIWHEFEFWRRVDKNSINYLRMNWTKIRLRPNEFGVCCEPRINGRVITLLVLIIIKKT
jgi:hypothetical protein